MANSNKKSRAKKSSVEENNDVMSQVIATNCKLVTEILNLKRSLFEKADALMKMQAKYYEEVMKHMNSNVLVKQRGDEIEKLKKEVENLKAAQFCTDLIKLDDSIAGKFVFYVVYFNSQYSYKISYYYLEAGKNTWN